MIDLPGPPIDVEEREIIVSGEEENFSKCKSFSSDFFREIDIEPEFTIYSKSPDWGDISRSIFSQINADNGLAERNTLICWVVRPSEAVSFKLDDAAPEPSAHHRP